MAGDELNVNSSLLTAWGNGTSGTSYNISWTGEATTPYNSLVLSDQKYPVDYPEGKPELHPRLYFKYVKSKMSMLEFSTFKRRMKYLEKLMEEFSKNGQQALAEDCIKKFVVLSRESALYACGFKLYVTQDILDKFKNKVKVPIKYTDIKNFGRVIPPTAAKKIRTCIQKKLFDSYTIVHLDNKEAVKETEQERINREKDPICFGKIQYSDRYYFVCDWVDELDNLRLETIIKALKLDKSKMKLSNKIVKGDLKDTPNFREKGK